MERMGHAYKPLAVLAMTLDGIPLLYNGQEEPLTRRLKFFDKDNIDFKHYTLGEFYKKLCLFKQNEEALWNAPYGAEAIKIADSADVYAFKREKGSSKVVVILNLSALQQTIFLKESLINMINIFNNEIVTINVSSPLKLEPWSYLVLKNNY
jgi:glycosidase